MDPLSVSAVISARPQIYALGVLFYALLLGGSTLAAFRFIPNPTPEHRRRVAQIVLFVGGWLMQAYPETLAGCLSCLGDSLTLPFGAWLPVNQETIQRAGWALALASALLLPLAKRGEIYFWQKKPKIELSPFWPFWCWRAALLLVAGALALPPGWLPVSALWPAPLSWQSLLLAVAALLYLPPAIRAVDTGGSSGLRLGMAGLFLLAAATEWACGAGISLLPAESVLLALMSFLVWERHRQRLAPTPQPRYTLLLLLALGVPLLAAASHLITASEQQYQRTLLHDANLRLELTKNRLQAMDAHHTDLLRMLVADPLVQAALRAPGGSHDFAMRILNRRIGAESIQLAARDGSVFAASRPELKQEDLSATRYFLAAMAGNAVVDYGMDYVSGLASTWHARPLLDAEGNTIAVLVVRFNLERIVADNVQLDQVVLHQRGAVLLASHHLDRGMLYGYRSAGEQWLTDTAGRHQLVTSVPLPVGDWELSRVIPATPMLAHRNTRIHQALLLFTLVVLLALRLLHGKAFIHILTAESEQRRGLEARERQARQEAEQAGARLLLERDRAEESAAKAEAADRSKSQFLANMSHEIRTPMNAVIGLCRQLQESALNPAQQRLLCKINSASGLLLHLINDILDLSRIESGRLELDPHPFFIAGLLDQIRSLFASEAAAKGLELWFEIAPELPPALNGDALRITQVLTNLVGNAIKFTDQGRVELRVGRAEPPASDLGASGRESAPAQPGAPLRLRCEVVDTGIGLNDQQLARIFKPFTQADSSTTRRYGGSGLGLTISQRLIEAMGSTLEVSSIPDYGSLFTFELPLTVAAPESVNGHGEAAAPTAAVPSLAGRTILLVEDNLLNQEVASFYLRKTTARILTARHGAEALRLLDEQRVDLVLLDLQMPVMDGFETARRLRQRFADLPMIAISGAVMEDDRQRALAAGMNDHLAKPIDERKLYRVLARWLPPDQNRALPATVESKENVSEQRAQKGSEQRVQKGSEQRAPQAATSGDRLPPWATPPTALLEEAGFNPTAAMREFDQDADFYRELLINFRDYLARECVALPDQLAGEVSDEARRTVHTLKSAAATVGAVRLAAAAVAIDAAGKRGEAISEAMRKELGQALQTALTVLPGATT